MAATSPSPMREVEQLIADQVRLFKQSVRLEGRDLLEYRLRHRSLEAADAFSQTLSKFWQFFWTEDQQSNSKDDQQMHRLQ